MKILGIIQARVSSTRLPRKVLLDLEGITVLEHVINRARSANSIGEVIVATTTEKDDTRIVEICDDKGVKVFRGSREDVLDRYYQAAKLFGPEHIVRITADCPLIDPKIMEKVIRLHLKEKADYTSNTIKETFPDGEDVEVFRFETLKKVWENAGLLSEREHVTAFIRKNPGHFKIRNLECNKNLSDKRWTLDNSEDYEFIKLIYKNLYNRNNLFGIKEIVRFLDKNPDIERINQDITRNEGYLKSLKNDRVLKKI